MRIIYLFPVAIIILNIGAALMFGIGGDWRKFIYFAAAAVLNLAVVV